MKGESAKAIVVFTSLLLASTLACGGSIPTLLPEAYEGRALVDGKPAQIGARVEARSVQTNELVGKGAVALDNGLYGVDIIFDDDLAAGVDEGADVGEPVKWCVDGIVASKPAPGEDTAETGELNIPFDLIVDSKAPLGYCTPEDKAKVKASTTVPAAAPKAPESSGAPASSDSAAVVVVLLILAAFILAGRRKKK